MIYERHLVALTLLLVSITALGQPPSVSQLSTPYPLLQQPVKIAGVNYVSGSVAYGPVGTPIVIRGANFGPTGTVSFLGTHKTTTATVPYISSDGTNISINVPSGATTGSLIVTKSNGQNSNAVPVIVTPSTYSAGCSTTVQPASAPNITGLSPSTGSAGTLVTITGTNFGASGGVVTFGGYTATVVNWQPTWIIAWVPSAVTANSPVIVVVSVDSRSSNGMTFNVTGAPQSCSE